MTRYRYLLVVGLIILGLVPSLSQEDYRSPVGHPIRLSGTFGELRGDHFHTGIDIKSSKGRSGDVVMAVQGGHVSRIKVMAASYGNVIYIDHPDGHTSVYAHLSQFRQDISEFVRAAQYAQESFEVDLEMDHNQFPVQQGDEIGQMGNSGFSFGPHLHFELRATASGAPVNPLLKDWPIKDVTKPIIQRTKLYHLDHRHQIHGEIDVQESSPDNPMEVNAWRIGLGVQTYDPFNGKANKNGVYEIRILVDRELHYQVKFDSIQISNYRSYLVHTDNAERIRTKENIHRCFRAPGNKLKIYPTVVNNGVISIFRDRSSRVDIEVLDFMGNKTKETYWVKRAADIKVPPGIRYNFMVEAGTTDTVTFGPLALFFEEKTLFQDLRLSISDSASTYNSALYLVGSAKIPLREPVLMTHSLADLTPASRAQTILCKIDSEGNISYQGATQHNDRIYAKLGSLGSYTLVRDSIPPTIEVLRNRKTKTVQQFTFEVEDNIEDMPLSYQAEIDDRWVLTSYDRKSNQLRTTVDLQEISKGARNFKLVVTDAVGNSTVYSTIIKLK